MGISAKNKMTFRKSDYGLRIDNAKSAMGELDALLVTGDENVRYFTGVDSGRVLITPAESYFWLNEVYFDRARNSYLDPIPIRKDMIKEKIFSLGCKIVGIDSINLEEYRAMDSKLRKLIKPSDVCSQLRKIKSKKEIELLEQAARIASDAISSIKPEEIIGKNEFEVTAGLEYLIRKNGSEQPPFGGGLLCLSGPNTKYPHAPPTDRKIAEGDLLIVDLGAVCCGYHSDMTRTFKIGAVSEEQSELVDMIDDLKGDAIDLVEIGGKIADVHNYINDRIEKAGYSFAHLSGHGVGLNIHERPSLGPSETDVFEEGMVFTIEPGVYKKEYGSRSEDTIALVNGKKKVLTSY